MILLIIQTILDGLKYNFIYDCNLPIYSIFKLRLITSINAHIVHYPLSTSLTFNPWLQVNINPSYKPGELEFTLRMVGVRCLFLDEWFRSTNYYDLIAEVLPELRVIGEATTHYTHKSLVLLHVIVVVLAIGENCAFPFDIEIYK